MVKIETLLPGRFFKTKCDIDNKVDATYQVVFQYGWKLYLCHDHLKELLQLKEEKIKW